MGNGDPLNTIRIQDGKWQSLQREVVHELPLKLIVNGRELVTLAASPHRLKNLVVGFLRLQGLIDELDDLLSLGACEESGVAEVRIKGEVPLSIRPTLTSGCGTGITFNHQVAATARRQNVCPESIAPQTVFTLMKALLDRADHYQRHGGIHSTAVGDGDQLLVYAEDIGRHNTIDRIAGEALFKGVPLSGKVLVTSGRVSSEMAAKAVQLGVVLIASRTSPTDMAVDLCREWGITMIGYVRGDSMTVYTCPERLIGAGAEGGLTT